MRILVAQSSFLGDVVLSTPVFAALRRHVPHAHISALVRPDSAAVLEGHPDLDAVLVDDKRGRDWGLGAVRVLKALRSGQFDLALALHKSFRTAWLLAAAGIPRRIGFRQSTGWFLYHERVHRDVHRHDVERNLSILAALDIDPDAARSAPFVACSEAATARFGETLRAHSIAPGAYLVGVAPGSAWATKRWTVDGFGALLNYLERELHATPVLLGAPADADYAQRIQVAAHGAGVNLVGKTDLPMLIAAIDQCRVLITNDSGPMHIAVARRTPVVAIFGPTTLAQGFGPYTDRAIVVQRDLSCRPCGRHGHHRCPIGTHACMRDIDASEVTGAVAALLDRYPAAQPAGTHL